MSRLLVQWEKSRSHAVVTADIAVVVNLGQHRLMTPASAELDAGSLFAAHHDRIYRYILHLVRNATEAEDLVQETFLRAHSRRESLRDPLAVRGWLYRIATHVCLDRLRQWKQHPTRERPDSDGQTVQIAASPSLMEITERKETSQCVQRCLEFLADRDRALILLHLAHRLSATEIAGLMHLKVGTVKMRLHRARQSLQKIMACGCAVSEDKRGVPVCQPKR